MYLGLSHISEMISFMSAVGALVLECVVTTDRSYTHRFTGGCHTLEPYTMSMGPLFQIYGNVSEIRNLFMLLVLAVLQKHLADGCRKMFFFFFFF